MTPGDIRENGGGEEKRKAKVVICIINSQAPGGRERRIKKAFIHPRPHIAADYEQTFSRVKNGGPTYKN